MAENHSVYPWFEKCHFTHDLKNITLSTWGAWFEKCHFTHLRSVYLSQLTFVRNRGKCVFLLPFCVFLSFFYVSLQSKKKKKKKKKRRRRQNKILEKQDQKIALVSFHSHRSWTRRIYPLEKSNPNQPPQKQKDDNKVSHWL